MKPALSIMPLESKEAWIEFPASFRDLDPLLTPSPTHPTLPHGTWHNRKGKFFWGYHIKLLWEHPTDNNMLYKFSFLLEALQVKPYNWTLDIFHEWKNTLTQKFILKDTRGVSSRLGQIEFSSHFVKLFRRFVMAYHSSPDKKQNILYRACRCKSWTLLFRKYQPTITKLFAIHKRIIECCKTW